MAFCVAILALYLAIHVSAKVPPPPDPQLDCDLRALALNVSTARVGNFADMGRVYDALQLSLCGVPRPNATAPAPATRSPAAADLVVWASASRGSDTADGESPSSPVASLAAAQRAARALRLANPDVSRRVTVFLEGRFHVREPLVLDNAADAHTSWRAWPGGVEPVISGGIRLPDLSWSPSSRYPAPVLEAALPSDALLPPVFQSLFDADAGSRLPLAREPNGDAERDLQPTGWALVDGNPNGTRFPFPAPGAGTHVEVDVPARNSSVFPVFGRDYDPRNPPIGYVWYTEGGGPASFFAGNKSFWNKTIDASSAASLWRRPLTRVIRADGLAPGLPAKLAEGVMLPSTTLMPLALAKTIIARMLLTIVWSVSGPVLPEISFVPAMM